MLALSAIVVSVRVVRANVWVIFPLMLSGMWTALTGSFDSHPAIPVVFTLLSTIIAIVPSSRKAGLTAALLWCAAAVGGSALTKYIGPLYFAAFGALTIAAVAAYSARWAEWLLYPTAFIEAAWVASLVRQTAFEIATVGHPTPTVDGCATYFLPVMFVVLLSLSGIVSVFPTMLIPKLRNPAEYGLPPFSRLGALNGWRWLAAGVALGAAFGLLTWHDWQINRPCM